MPTRLADAEPIPVGEDAEPAGFAEGLVALPVLAHVPEAVPKVPPPSKRLTEPGVVGIDVPVLMDVPIPVPVRFPAIELTPEHVAMLPVGPGAAGDTPEVMGLTPTDPSSVVPNGIPVPGTEAAGPMPRGEVMPIAGGALPPIWADAEPQPNKTIASTAITKRVIAVFSSPRIMPAHRQPFRKKWATVFDDSCVFLSIPAAAQPRGPSETGTVSAVRSPTKRQRSLLIIALTPSMRRSGDTRSG